MRLTKHTDYAFRVLIYLAINGPETCTIPSVVEQFQISKSHVMKIASKLVAAGYVESIRGKNGGIRLGKSPNSINLRDIVELMEHTLEPVDCADGPCVILKSCRLKGILDDAQSQYLQHLQRYTLKDLVPPNGASELPLRPITITAI